MALSRRTFLHVAGLTGVAATAVSCSGGPVTEPTTTAPASPAPSTTKAPLPDWDRLRRVLDGALVLPNDDDYDTARRSYNPLFDDRRPTAVAMASSAEHVRACVETARDARLPIAARSGGHSYAGYSTPDDGLVVDLAGLSTVEVREDGTAVVGAGARLIDVYAALAGAGRSLPAGSCPTVGIAGLTLGGGLSVLSRKYGLTCDKLVSAQLVTADSRGVVASAESEPELFWALRGGGGGNFGIVTEFTFATDPAPDVTVFTLDFPPGSVADVVGAWQRWSAEAPDELWSTLIASGGGPPRCQVRGCFVGSRRGLTPLLDALVTAAGTRPSSRAAESMDYLGAMRHFAGCADGPLSRCAPGRVPRAAFAASSRVLSTPLDDPAALAALLDGRDGMDLLLDALGGAVAAVGPTDTAFPYREALATVQIYQEATQDTGPDAARAVVEVRDGLGRLGVTGGYVNYIEPNMPDWPVVYYGQNLNRLRDIATRYDPDAVFTFAQSLTRA
ncbi:FAD-binding oxidoreductase [Actinokineospora sp. 24-640]